MRRTLAGLLFGLAYLCVSLCVAGFLLQRIAFEPARSAASPAVVLADSGLSNEIAGVIAKAAAEPLHRDEAELRTLVLFVEHHPQGRAYFSTLIHDAHTHLIGGRAVVQLTSADLVSILRTERAATLAPITFVVPRSSVLTVTRTILKWMIPLAAIAFGVFLALGLTAHPDAAGLMRSLALGLAFLALLVLIFAYLLPKFAIPALGSSPWLHIAPRMADDASTLTVALIVVLLGGALALVLSTGAMQRRRRWSTPISTYRYAEERRWS